jgi:cation diffusion facilitator family transporter
LSVASNIALTAGKLVVGSIIGSVSVISEAIHSANDLLASFIALWAVRKSAQPPDQEHPYGHGKVENIAGTIEAVLIFIAAVFIISESIEKIRQGGEILEPGTNSNGRYSILRKKTCVLERMRYFCFIRPGVLFSKTVK